MQVIFVIVGVFSCLLLQISGESCVKQFKNFADMGKHMMTCKEKLNLKDEDISKNPTEDLVKNGYEDKCFYKCMMLEMKMAKDDGTIDVKAVEDDLKKNAPADKADALIAVIKTCIEAAAKDPAVSKDPCKSIAMMKTCYLKEDAKMC